MIQYDFGNEPGAGVIDGGTVPPPSTRAGHHGTWYGIDQYLYLHDQRVLGRRACGSSGSATATAARPRRRPSGDYYETYRGPELDSQQARHATARAPLGLDGHARLSPLRRRHAFQQFLLDCDLIVRF